MIDRWFELWVRAGADVERSNRRTPELLVTLRVFLLLREHYTRVEGTGLYDDGAWIHRDGGDPISFDEAWEQYLIDAGL